MLANASSTIHRVIFLLSPVCGEFTFTFAFGFGFGLSVEVEGVVGFEGSGGDIVFFSKAFRAFSIVCAIASTSGCSFIFLPRTTALTAVSYTHLDVYKRQPFTPSKSG